MATVELGPRLHPADDHATAKQCRGFELFRRERLKLLEEQLDRSRHAAAVLDAALDLVRAGRLTCHHHHRNAECGEIRPRAGLQQQADGRQLAIDAGAEDGDRACYTANVRAGAGFEKR